MERKIVHDEKHAFAAVRNSHGVRVNAKKRSNAALKLFYLGAEDLSEYFFASDASFSIIMYILYSELFYYTMRLVFSYPGADHQTLNVLMDKTYILAFMC